VSALWLGSLPCSRAQDAAPGDDARELRERVRELEERQKSLEKKLEERGPPTEPKPSPADARPAGGAPGVTIDPSKEERTIKLDLPFVKKLTIGGKVRLRGEVRDPKDYRVPGTFGRAANDDPGEGSSFVLLRTRLSFDFEVSDPLRAFVEISDSRRFGDEDANGVLDPDVATVNLYQAFVELRLKSLLEVPVSVRAGRFEVLSLGDQRLISSLDWSNVGRAWDGVQATWDTDWLWATAFATTIREGGVFANLGDGDRDFYVGGLYASVRAIPKHELDGYVLWRWLGDRTAFTDESGRRGKRQDFTFGARIKGAQGPIDYTGEAAAQLGRQASDEIKAFMGAATAGFTLELEKDVKLRLGGEYAYASGDGNAADGKIRTFDPILPFGHFYHGHADLIGFMNLHAAATQVMFQPMKDLSFHVDGHSFWLDKTADAWYDAGKNRVRRDSTGSRHSHLGFEVDGYVKSRVLDRIWVWTGYSHFFPGVYVNRTGKSPGQDWVFLQVEAKF
jgi:hypothetical protein